MSKFAKPKPPAATAADVERIIAAAAADDDKLGSLPGTGKVTFTMILPGELATAIDAARRPLGLSRLSFIRMKLAQALGLDDK